MRFFIHNTLGKHPQSERYRYAFDVIGELYFGEQFGFMKEGTDHGTYMESTWNLVSALAWVAMLPRYAQKAVFAGGFAIPSVRRGSAVMQNMMHTAKQRVAERQRNIREGKPTRQDLLGKSLTIHHERGEEENFLLEDAEAESYTALYSSLRIHASDWISDER